MHCCCVYIVIPCQVAGFHAPLLLCILLYRARLLGSMHCCCVDVVVPCQVAGFHALLIGEHCCTRLQGSVQCCCMLLSFPVCYCRVLCGVCRVWCCHAWLLIPGWQVCTHYIPFWPAEYTVTCIFRFSAPLCHLMPGYRNVGHYCCACYVPGGQWWLLQIG